MRVIIGVTILVVGGLMSVVGATHRKQMAVVPQRPMAERQRLIVHEWGTFTNFSGSDGVQLEFRPLVDQELPPFIYERAWQGNGPLTKPQLVARQRMETPVTYFYSDRPRELNVRVDFPRGLLTEFYPPPIEIRETMATGSSLSWKITVLPPDSGAAADGACSLPEVKDDDHYGFARETDSAVVRAVDRTGAQFDEKFLFYRGVGNFSLPLRMEALPGRRFRIINDGDAIDSLFVVIIDDDGLHFCQHDGVMAGTMREAVVPQATADSDELGDRMAESLVAAGLFGKEARAMIKTWQSSWFKEPGARLFYLVPRRLTDEILPLSVEPSPDAVVRVLVGRMETLTPEAINRLTSVIDGLGTCVSVDAEPWRSELTRLGRFAEPALAYLKSQETDPARREVIDRLTGLRR